MSLTRKCGTCGEMIRQDDCIELTARVIKTTGGENQDSTESVYDDFCATCIVSGKALNTLMKELGTAVIGEL